MDEIPSKMDGKNNTTDDILNHICIFKFKIID